MARMVERPTTLDYIDKIFTNFFELHGDRCFKDDKSIVGGIGLLDGNPVTIIGIQKGKDLKENMERNFGSPHPEGYRKTLRLMKQAEKFNRPIICFINTSGAYCGIGAEERGQGEAIARNLIEIAQIRVPIISIVIGEGGSGGALALACGDRVWMLENSVYSILSPEGFASILLKDPSKSK
ncbi:acetyl-CoA carboxylase carboxyl transferase subunit alpha, partial [Clostridium perfringens]|nr:acetyl-CoA carboxylase carboxyl transferase subunit alpha [Clostridium perfringens]